MYKYCIFTAIGVFAMNMTLFGAIFSIAFTVLIGVLMIILFVNGYSQPLYVLGAVGIGALVSIPVAYIVTKKLSAPSDTK